MGNDSEKEVDDALREQHRLLQTLIDSIPTPVYYKDERGVYLGCNAEFEKFIGRPSSEIIGKTVYDVASKAFADKNDSSDRNLLKKGGKIVFESAVKGADGTPREVLFHKTVLTRSDGSPSGLVGSMLDITLHKKAEEQLRHMANLDGLTGIPNRNLGKDRLAVAIAQARRNQSKMGVLYVDLDGFKEVNDRLGKDAGDQLLRQVAQRLVKAVRESDTVARFAGDEFTVIITDVKEPESLKKVAENVLQSLKAPIIAGGQEIQIGASIGIALWPNDGGDVNSLVGAADTAMYQVKMNGKGTYRFAAPPAQAAE